MDELKKLNFNKLVILEDFQYLSEETTRDLSVELKHLLEEGFKFLIIGIWTNKVRLNTYNGDLSGRMHYINCSDWSSSDLKKVILKGAEHLNITWADEIIDLIVNSSMANIGIMQRICHQVCESMRIRETQANCVLIADIQLVHNIIGKIIQQEQDRLNENFVRIAKGFNKSKHELYRWILKCILSCDESELVDGLHRQKLYTWVHDNHPQNGSIHNTSIDMALSRIVQLQNRENIRPPLFDYALQKIMIVDDYLLLYLRSLNEEELSGLVEMI